MRTDTFAPSRWLASPRTLRALRRSGFAVCADSTAVHDLRAGVARRGRVLGFGAMPTQHAPNRDGAGRWVLGAAHAARRGGLVRLAGAVLGITDCCVDDPAGFSEIPVEYRVTIVWLVYRGAARGLGQMPGRVCCCGVSDSSGLPVAQR